MPWTCQACTYHNNDSASSCGICGTAKPVGDCGQWKCIACTFANIASATQCSICATKKPSKEKKKPDPKRKPAPRSRGRKDGLTKIFETYEGKNDDAGLIADDDLDRYFADIGIGGEKNAHLQFGLFYKLQLEAPGEISKDGFMDGWRRLGCKTIKEMKTKCAQMRREYTTNQFFAPFYTWLFEFNLPENKKYLKVEEAKFVWDIVLPPRWPLHGKWGEFVQYYLDNPDLQSEIRFKSVSRDLWTCLWDFIRDVRTEGSNWESKNDGSWPRVVDEFVRWLQDESVFPWPEYRNEEAEY